MKSATRSEPSDVHPQLAPHPQNNTCRAFAEYFAFFLIHYAGMRYLMHFHAFRRGKFLQCPAATQCEARRQCSISRFPRYQVGLWEIKLHKHPPATFLYVPAQLRVHPRQKARHVRTAHIVSKLSATLAEQTCRAFHGIFRFFKFHYAGMRYLMHFRAFWRGKSL